MKRVCLGTIITLLYQSRIRSADKIKTVCGGIFAAFGLDIDNFNKELPSHLSGDCKNFEDRITHILFHIQDSNEQIKRILSCESGELFMQYMKGYLKEVFCSHIIASNQTTPQEYILNHMVSSFAETIKWWFNEKHEYSPKEVADFYLSVQAVKMM